jgi:protein-disulfide isomerase
VLEQYPEKVKLVFKNYPLSSHKFSVKAALTAYAAHLQGRFWAVHDELFKHHEQLSDEKIDEIARAAALDAERLERDRRSPQVTKHVQEDYNEALRIGVRGVPAVFVNGRRLRDRGFDSLVAAIEKELKKAPKR